MKHCYVAVGGIACRALKTFSKTLYGKGRTGAEARCYYYDTDLRNDPLFEKRDARFVFADYPYGKGSLRLIGKELFRKYLYSGALRDFTGDAFFASGDVTLTLVTTSFGGFGSAVVFDLAEYLYTRLSVRARRPRTVTLRVIAFDRSIFEHQFRKDEHLAWSHGLNSIDFVGEHRLRAARRSEYFPEISLFLVGREAGVTEEMLHTLIGCGDDELRRLDAAEQYATLPTVDAIDVFISYSTKDKEIAELLRTHLSARGLSVWISSENMEGGAYAAQIIQAIRASKVFAVVLSKDSVVSGHVLNEIDRGFDRIREGMHIMPFRIDRCKLSDSCEYYLCRQQQFEGSEPPIDERIRAFTDEVVKVLQRG